MQTLAFDAADHNAVRAAVDGFEAADGAINILINNAGIQHRTALDDFPPDAFERLLQTNVASVFHVAQTCARHMIARRSGKIIDIASVQTALARPGIASGYFDTPLNAALVADPEFSAWLEKRTPAGRWGQVEELVGAAVFMSSSAFSFVNGHRLFVDGGITASL